MFDAHIVAHMLVVETLAKIRRSHFMKKKAIKAICRDLKVSRNVVRKVGFSVGLDIAKHVFKVHGLMREVRLPPTT
ncbi:hypothetical protein ACLB6G_12465 [Zhengella sp. ZM62]|uniref:hypothetical protein n=1 Tax=Zhengella sedimenti TaxID=3390035 RepID=UPI0039769E6F